MCFSLRVGSWIYYIHLYPYFVYIPAYISIQIYYIHICLILFVFVLVYIYIYGERERERREILITIKYHMLVHSNQLCCCVPNDPTSGAPKCAPFKTFNGDAPKCEVRRELWGAAELGVDVQKDIGNAMYHMLFRGFLKWGYPKMGGL